MWGLWLVVSNTEVQKHQQQHVSWPVADPKVIQKLSSFDDKSTVNIWLSSSGQQADFCSVQFHCKVQLTVHNWDHMEALPMHHQGTWDVARRPEPVPLDVDQEIRHPWQQRDDWIPAKKSVHLRQEVTPTMLETGKTWHCTVDNLLCQGHMTLTRCWEHQTLC